MSVMLFSPEKYLTMRDVPFRGAGSFMGSDFFSKMPAGSGRLSWCSENTDMDICLFSAPAPFERRESTNFSFMLSITSSTKRLSGKLFVKTVGHGQFYNNTCSGIF